MIHVNDIKVGDILYSSRCQLYNIVTQVVLQHSRRKVFIDVIVLGSWRDIVPLTEIIDWFEFDVHHNKINDLIFVSNNFFLT